jgi:ABC-type transport system involved in multi-copper enzyme maturation permease subunit
LVSTLWAITKNSFREIIRQPVYGILLLSGMILIGGSPAITMFSMARDDSLMVDIALTTIMLLGIVIAVLSATQVISREIEAQTVGAVLSKPVARFIFVLGKFLAVSLAMALSWFVLTVVLMCTLRIGVPSSASWRLDWPAFLALTGPLLLSMGLGIYCNYFYRWNFASTAIALATIFYALAFAALLVISPTWEVELIPVVFLSRDAWEVAKTAMLVFLAVWVLSSVAVAASVRLNVVVNVIICLTVFFVGMISQFLFGRFAEQVWAWTALRLLPSLHLFWVGDALMVEAPFVPMPYVKLAAIYAVAYCGAMLALATFLFERREVT